MPKQKPKVNLPELGFKNDTKTPDTTTAKDVFQEIDKRDEYQQRQIAIKGHLTSEPFYSLDVEYQDDSGKTKKVYGISISGVFDIAKNLHGIGTLGMPMPEHDEQNFVYHQQVRNNKTDVTTIGVGIQSRMIKTANGVMEDKFARIIAMAKAKRNGIRELLNNEDIENYFKKWYAEKFNKPCDRSEILIVGENVNLKNFINNKPLP